MSGNKLEEYRELNRIVDQIYDEAGAMNMSWPKLAKKAGLSYITVWKLGTRWTQYPRASTVMRLAKAVGFTLTLEKKVKLRLRA